MVLSKDRSSSFFTLLASRVVGCDGVETPFVSNQEGPDYPSCKFCNSAAATDRVA